MDEHVLMIEAVHDGRVCTFILRGDLDLLAVDGFLEQAALVIDERCERLILDLAGVTFLDCAGVRALAMAMSSAPFGCPVVVRSLSPIACRLLGLVRVDLENIPGLSMAQEPRG